MQQKRGKQRKTVKIFVTFKALYFRLYAHVLVFIRFHKYMYA